MGVTELAQIQQGFHDRLLQSCLCFFLCVLVPVDVSPRPCFQHRLHVPHILHSSSCEEGAAHTHPAQQDNPVLLLMQPARQHTFRLARQIPRADTQSTQTCKALIGRLMHCCCRMMPAWKARQHGSHHAQQGRERVHIMHKSNHQSINQYIECPGGQLGPKTQQVQFSEFIQTRFASYIQKQTCLR